MTYLEKRLEEWATWFIRGHANGLGFSERSIEFRLITEGIITKSTAPQTVPIHEEAEEIEALVSEMNDYHKPMADALRIQYFSQEGFKERAMQLGISYPLFQNHVKLARYWLAGRLSAEK